MKVTRHLLSSVLKLGQLSVYVPRETVGCRTPTYSCLPTAHSKSVERRFREHRPEDYATSALPYEYDPEADCEVFKAVLRKAAPDAVGFLQEFAGYCLTPDTSLETALWFKGPRGSGKSTVIEGLVAMLGDKHGVLGLGEIESSPFALSRIPGKTLLVSTEQPSSYLRSTHVIDALISGESIIMDRKHRDAEEVTPTAKIVWAMNEAPRIANTTSGIFRRVKIVEFPALEGERDPDVKEYVKSEGAGILNWALEGLARLRERGGFEFPKSVVTATAEFEKANDLPAQFVEEECVVGSVFGGRLQHALLALQGLVRRQRPSSHEQQPRRRRMEASRIYTLQGFGRPAVLEGVEDAVINVTSGAQWHTYGAVCGWCATPRVGIICRILSLIVAQVAHHINKYMENNKINVDRGTLGFSCATCATCYVLIPIGKPKSTVAHCASVRHSGVPLKRSVS